MLVHGAGSGPYVFDGWPAWFPGVETIAVDLHAGLDVGRASHADYAARVVVAARAAREPVALCGWSMGGLVVLQAAERAAPHSVVLLEASPPAEVQGLTPDAPIVDGAFDPEEAYGVFPPGMRPRPESTRARSERKRGISVPSLPCPSLVVHGDSFPEERGRALADVYGSDLRAFPGFDHWDLVLRPEVPAAVAAWRGVSPSA